jgi:hypothetical protein
MLDAKKTVPKDKLNRSPACLYLRSVTAGVAGWGCGSLVGSSYQQNELNPAHEGIRASA